MRYGLPRRWKPITDKIQDGWWANGARQPIVCCKSHATYGCYYAKRDRHWCASSLIPVIREIITCNRLHYSVYLSSRIDELAAPKLSAVSGGHLSPSTLQSGRWLHREARGESRKF
ncbi:hypothetical protein ElyMa_004150400 [Elysia marginata]|uniref:Uncharacterized protein n=1 Tax=Elysia marginata TaxID=1093978 RepID=A0AAV4GH71_9GAST|nr:hypothetical protein ElyMa_004150400 [Elysia marginata]